MAFPDSFVEEVRRAADIARVVSDFVVLKKTGASFKGLCPFHKEKTPSFNVRGEYFHCFGCGEGGDVFKFLMRHERVSFPEAVETLARRFGVPLPEKGPEPGPDRKEREALLALMEAAAEHFARALWTAPGARAREYLLGRGFQKETLEKIRAGSARDSWSDLLEALKREFPVAALVTAGLVLEKQGGHGHYDRFRNRAVFPILNESGRVVAFGARSLDGSEPKYLNSPETPVYQKSRTLYGLSWAKDAIRLSGRVVLMEGYLDVARALEAGIPEAVATCGTALTPGQARLLRRFAERVVLNFDQDPAGQNATRKSLDVLLEEGLRVHVVELPDGHDPDTFLKAHGAEAYRERLERAPEAMEWLIRRSASDNDTRSPSGKAAYLAALLPALSRLESAVERAAWLRLIADKGGLEERAAEQELRKALGLARRDAPPPPPAPPPPSAAGLLPAEKFLLALLLAGVEGSDEALGELTDADLAGLPSAGILRRAKALYLKGERVTGAGLAAGADDAEGRALTEIAVEGLPAEGLTAEACVKELKRLPLKARMAEIQKNLSTAEGSDLEALLQEKLHIRRLMANS